MRRLLKQRALQVVALIALITGVGTVCFLTKYCVIDPDVWWHLKVGDWVLQHHAVPHNGIFSSSATNHPWVAYSWGYEVLLSLFYSAFGLMGIGWYGLVLTLLVALSIFWMLHRLSHRFWSSWLLTIVTVAGFLFHIAPRPVFFSMACFAVVLTLILEAERKGRIEGLYVLPVIFVLWANLHIQFVYGLFLLGLLMGVHVVLRTLEATGHFPQMLARPTLPLLPLIGLFAVCLPSCCLGPYSWHLYQVVFEYSRSKVPYTTVQELQALNFETFGHYLVLGLGAGAFFAIGWSRKISLFKLALMLIASVVAFRTRRDAWFLCVPAAACIADFPSAAEVVRNRARQVAEWAGIALASAMLLLLIAPNVSFNSMGIAATIRETFPVDAVNYIRRNPAPGPLYNNLSWGGFLIWYMPEFPVAIDGRNELYGDEADARSYSTERGESSYASNPQLRNAGLVVLKRSLPLTGILSMDARFRIAYQDDVAVVFVRQ